MKDMNARAYSAVTALAALLLMAGCSQDIPHATIVGRPPAAAAPGNLLPGKAPARPTAYCKVGKASFYEGGGSRGASGMRLKRGMLYAAHRTLPFGTVVRVTNLKNGRSCLCRIADRGPFHRHRIIDVSSAAARELGMVRAGVATVRVETVNAR